MPLPGPRLGISRLFSSYKIKTPRLDAGFSFKAGCLVGVLEQVVFAALYFFFELLEFFLGYFLGLVHPVAQFGAGGFAGLGGEQYAEGRADEAADHERSDYFSAFVI